MTDDKTQQPLVATALVPEKNYPSLGSLVAVVVIVLLLFAFVTGRTIQFYASFLFWFYSMTTSMWISVVMLGIFQTFLMMPIRIVNLFKGSNTEAFKNKVEELEQKDQQHFLVKRHAKKGTPVFLWYLVTFFISAISYISMGRLFLIDFYSHPVNPKLLYDWVPYPEYPIKGVMFKIPYVGITETTDFGLKAVFLVWMVLIGIRVVVALIKYIVKRVRRSSEKSRQNTPQRQMINRMANFWNGSFFLILIGVWFLMRHFPIGFELRIFTGSVAIPNRTLNVITAIATAFTIVWLDMSKMRKRSVLAREQGISEEIIQETSRDQFKDSLRNGGLLGLGAFFITNHIPSAFELSIFTLEIISWVAPFTIDKIILTASKNGPGDKGQNGGEEIKENSDKSEKITE